MPRLEQATGLDPIVSAGQRAAWLIRAGRIRDGLNGVWLGHPLHPLLAQAATGAGCRPAFWTLPLITRTAPGSSARRCVPRGPGLRSGSARPRQPGPPSARGLATLRPGAGAGRPAGRPVRVRGLFIAGLIVFTLAGLGCGLAGARVSSSPPEWLRAWAPVSITWRSARRPSAFPRAGPAARLSGFSAPRPVFPPRSGR